MKSSAKLKKFLNCLLALVVLLELGLGLYLASNDQFATLGKGVLTFLVFDKIYMMLLLIPIMFTSFKLIRKTGGETPTKTQMIPGLLIVYAFATLIIWGSLSLLSSTVRTDLKLWAQVWLVGAMFGGCLRAFLKEYKKDELEGSALTSLMHGTFTLLAGGMAIVAGALNLNLWVTLLIMFASSVLLVPYHSGLHSKVAPPPTRVSND